MSQYCQPSDLTLYAINPNALANTVLHPSGISSPAIVMSSSYPVPGSVTWLRVARACAGRVTFWLPLNVTVLTGTKLVGAVRVPNAGSLAKPTEARTHAACAPSTTVI